MRGLWELPGSPGEVGCAAGAWLTLWMSYDWPLVVGGKPVGSVPPYVVIMFEMTILFGALATLLGIAFNALFAALLARNWTAEIEAEAFALLPRLQEPADPRPWEAIAAEDHERGQSLIAQLLAQISGLHRLVDRMIEARTQAEMTKLQDTGHPENLTRQELAAKEAEFRKASSRLDKVAAKHTIHKNTAARKRSRLAKRLNAAKAAKGTKAA